MTITEMLCRLGVRFRHDGERS